MVKIETILFINENVIVQIRRLNVVLPIYVNVELNVMVNTN